MIYEAYNILAIYMAIISCVFAGSKGTYVLVNVHSDWTLLN